MCLTLKCGRYRQMKNKRPKRSFETVFIQSDKPLNLRVFVDLIVKKIERGEINANKTGQRKIR